MPADTRRRRLVDGIRVDVPAGLDYGFIVDGDAALGRSAIAEAAERRARTVAHGRPAAASVAAIAPGRAATRAARSSTSCIGHVHRRRHPRRGDRASRPPALDRGGLRRAAAGERLQRRARLGLRRSAGSPSTNRTAARMPTGASSTRRTPAASPSSRTWSTTTSARAATTCRGSARTCTRRADGPWGSAMNLDGPAATEVRAFIVDNAAALAARPTTSTGCGSTPCTRCSTQPRRTSWRRSPRVCRDLSAHLGAR